MHCVQPAAMHPPVGVPSVNLPAGERTLCVALYASIRAQAHPRAGPNTPGELVIESYKALMNEDKRILFVLRVPEMFGPWPSWVPWPRSLFSFALVGLI